LQARDSGRVLSDYVNFSPNTAYAAPVQGIQEQKLAKALPCVPLVHGEPPEKSHRDIWVGGEFSRCIWRKI
jgi:hypothetical protein